MNAPFPPPVTLSPDATRPDPPSQDCLIRQLRAAVDAADEKACRAALAQGANPNARYWARSHYTIFTQAILKRFTAGALLMLEHGATVEAKRDRGFESPLFAAATSNDAQVCRRLLSLGVRVDARNPARRTALLVAARAASVDVGRILIEHGANISLYDKRQCTALHKAAASKEANALEFTKMLLAAGADPNFVPASPSPDYLTPFQWALVHGKPHVVKYLIDEHTHLTEGKTLAGKDLTSITSMSNAQMLLAARAQRSVEVTIGSIVSMRDWPIETGVAHRFGEPAGASLPNDFGRL